MKDTIQTIQKQYKKHDKKYITIYKMSNSKMNNDRNRTKYQKQFKTITQMNDIIQTISKTVQTKNTKQHKK